MKIKFTILLSIFMAVYSFGQIQQSFNDTLFPYGPAQNNFYHIFEQDSNYYIEGYKTGSPDFKFFLKTNKSGAILQKKSYDPNMIGFGGRYSNAVIQTNFGFVCATTIYDTAYHYHSVIMAIDYNLDTLWVKRYPYAIFSNNPLHVHNSFDDIKQTWEGGYILSGHYYNTAQASPWHPFLMKIDKDGNIQWYKDFPNIGHCTFTKIEVCPDYGILILAHKNQSSVIKTNALGTIQWEKPLLNNKCYFEVADMVYTGNSEYFIASHYVYDYDQYNSWFGIHLCKINSLTGQYTMDTNYIPFPTFEFYPKMQVQVVNTDKILVSGTAIAPNTSGTDFADRGVMLLYNQNGDSLGYRCLKYEGLSNSDSWLNDLLVTKEGDFVGVGTFASNYGFPGWFFRFNSNGIIGMEENKNTSSHTILQIFPNPSSDYCFFRSPITTIETLKLYDLQGNLVLNENTNSFDKEYIKIDVSTLKAGLYILKAESSKETYFGKILVQY